MEKVIGFFRLVRWPNLLFIILTQFLVQYFILLPVMHYLNLEPSLNHFQFSLLVLSTVFIAAAGYIINDYFDVGIDHINRPHSIVIDRVINRRWAMALHMVFNFLAFILGVYVGYVAGNWKLGFIFIFTGGILWFYSTSFKKQMLIGNIMVAALTGLVVLIVGLYETRLYNIHVIQNLRNTIPELALIRWAMIQLFGYSFFAFFISLIREIVKDMEDMEGDENYSANTLPITIGIRHTKWIAMVLCAVMIGMLVVVQIGYLDVPFYFGVFYILLMIQLPMFINILLLQKAGSREDFHRISNILKAVMLFGILSIALFYFISI